MKQENNSTKNMTLYLDQLKAILNKYPDTMECFIKNNKLVCKESTVLVKSEVKIDIPIYFQEGQ
jgi:hypothetical protein